MGNKQGILFYGFGSKNWIGGLYYIKNIVYQLTVNPAIDQNYNIFIYTTKDTAAVFDDIKEKKTFLFSNCSKEKARDIEVIFLCKKYHIKYIFPSSKEMSFMGIRTIFWIPDFQHLHYPQYFTAQEVESRNEQFSKIANSAIPLVLSSQDSFNDYKRYFEAKNKAYVIHFVSYIENNISRVVNNNVDTYLAKYNLDKVHYACIMNQFWPHKNHLIVFKALQKYYSRHPGSEFYFVFTGMVLKDRNPEYMEQILLYLKDSNVQKHVIFPGFIDRDEQLAIMMGSEFVIQPSLFEGWGTVVEDAKVLDKTVLLSDIPVHREQKNEKCVLFNPKDAEELTELIEIESNKTHDDNVQNGIDDMHIRALRYSKEFEKMLEECR